MRRLTDMIYHCRVCITAVTSCSLTKVHALDRCQQIDLDSIDVGVGNSMVPTTWCYSRCLHCLLPMSYISIVPQVFRFSVNVD